MPRDGLGNYTLPHDFVADADSVPPVPPSPARFQEQFDDIAAQINDTETTEVIIAQMASKANTSDVNDALSLKANTSDVDAALALKANTSDVNAALALKANTSDVNAALALKADAKIVDTVADLANIEGGAGITNVMTKGYAEVGDGGGGWFTWIPTDESANVALDTYQAITVAPVSNPSGSAGAWRRIVGDVIDALWFGIQSVADVTARINAWSTYAGVDSVLREFHCKTGRHVLGAGGEATGSGIRVVPYRTYDFGDAEIVRNFSRNVPALPSDALLHSHASLDPALTPAPLDRVIIRGGKWGADDYTKAGSVFYLWLKNSTVGGSGMRFGKWTGGLGFFFGGENLYIHDIEAMEGDTGSTGTGSFRCFGGKDITIVGVRCKSGDDALQVAPMPYDSTIAVSNMDSERIVYIGCSGWSEKGRAFVHLLVNNGGNGGMTCRVKDCGWIGCGGISKGTTGNLRIENEDSTADIEGSFWDDCVADMDGNTEPGAAVNILRDVPTETVTFSATTPCVVSGSVRYWDINAPVVFTTTGALPAGVVSGTTYYVATSDPDTLTFTFSATLGGAEVAAVDVGTGVHTATLVVGRVHHYKVNGSVRGYEAAAVRIKDAPYPDVKLLLDAGRTASSQVVDILGVDHGSIDIDADVCSGATLLRLGAGGQPCSNIDIGMTCRGMVNTGTAVYMGNLQATTNMHFSRLDMDPGSGDATSRALTISSDAHYTTIAKGDLTRLAQSVSNRIIVNAAAKGTRVLDGVRGSGKMLPTAALVDAAHIAWDMRDGCSAAVTLGGNRTLDFPSNLRVGEKGMLEITQDGTGSRTLTFAAGYVNPNGGTPGAPLSDAGATTRYAVYVASSTVVILTRMMAVSADPALASNSDAEVATVKATKAYVDATAQYVLLVTKTFADVSGGILTITDLNQGYKNLIVEMTGWSHDDGGTSRSPRLYISFNNGSSYPTFATLATPITAAQNVGVVADIINYSSTTLTKAILARAGGNNIVNAIDATASAVNAIKIDSSGGNIDALTRLTVWGVK